MLPRCLVVVIFVALAGAALAWAQVRGREIAALHGRLADLQRENDRLRGTLGQPPVLPQQAALAASYVPAGVTSTASDDEALFRNSLWIVAVGVLVVVLNCRKTAVRHSLRPATLASSSGLRIWTP